MVVQVVPLGAGQDVGRSCVLVSVGGKNVMFDCGMHMGYNDERRFPDFNYISKDNRFTELIDAVVITHFHLDHCGALPYFSEMCGYHGPIYMTHPTKAIAPILLEDYRKITVDRKGETNFFTSKMIKDCMKKVIAVNIHQTIQVDDDLELTAYYAGHVLGAAMFHVRVGSESAVYTGDYNMTPDRHLGAAWIEKVRPDVLITESTYATTIRDSKRARERDFLKKVHDCVAKGGKVLIPVFALGRAQELCILLDSYWDRVNLKVPIYFSAGMTEKANQYYKLFINWTNEKIKKTFVQRNMFDFKHIGSFDRSYADAPGPMVLFATPGMLHAGTSLEVFKKWAPSEDNMVIMPGYCVAGTVGAKVLAGQKQIEIDKKTTVEVRMQVQHLSFSAHADAKGIMQLIRMCEPRNVILVHGEKGKMGFLKDKIVKEFGVNCYDPPNGMTVTLQPAISIGVQISDRLRKRPMSLAPDSSSAAMLSDDDEDRNDFFSEDDDEDEEDDDTYGGNSEKAKRALEEEEKASSSSSSASSIGASSAEAMDADGNVKSEKTTSQKHSKRSRLLSVSANSNVLVDGMLVMDADNTDRIQLLDVDEASSAIDMNQHTVQFRQTWQVTSSSLQLPSSAMVADVRSWLRLAAEKTHTILRQGQGRQIPFKLNAAALTISSHSVVLTISAGTGSSVQLELVWSLAEDETAEFVCKQIEKLKPCNRN